MESNRLAKLIENAKQGDRNALEELFSDAFGSIYRLALRILKNQEDAEDITQEVFITIQQKISDLREPAAFYAWANQITANKCNRFFNRHKGLIRSDDEDELLSIADDDPENMPDKALDDDATRKIIMTVIDNLPDNQRMCILLFYYGQLTVADIAVALETNENTVKTRLSMARAKIRAALEEKAEKDGIKLWGVPLVLAPIVREAMENMHIPIEVQARINDSVANSDISGQTDPTAGAESVVAESIVAESAVGLTATTVTTGGAILGAKAIVAIICGLVVTAAVAGTAIFFPQIREAFSSSDNISGVEAELSQREYNNTTQAALPHSNLPATEDENSYPEQTMGNFTAFIETQTAYSERGVAIESASMADIIYDYLLIFNRRGSVAGPNLTPPWAYGFENVGNPIIRYSEHTLDGNFHVLQGTVGRVNRRDNFVRATETYRHDVGRAVIRFVGDGELLKEIVLEDITDDRSARFVDDQELVVTQDFEIDVTGVMELNIVVSINQLNMGFGNIVRLEVGVHGILQY